MSKLVARTKVTARAIVTAEKDNSNELTNAGQDQESKTLRVELEIET